MKGENAMHESCKRAHYAQRTGVEGNCPGKMWRGKAGGRAVKNGLLLYWGWNSSEIWLRTDSVQLICRPWVRFCLPGPCGAGVSWQHEDEVVVLSATGVTTPGGVA